MEITSASTAEKEEANRCHLPLKGPVRQSAIFCSEGHFFFFLPQFVFYWQSAFSDAWSTLRLRKLS